MNKSKIEYYAHLTVALLGAGVALFIFFRYLFFPLLPFVIAWATAFLLRPAVSFLSGKTKLPRKAVSVTLTILCVCIGLGLLSLFIFLMIKEAWALFSSIAANEQFIAILAKLTNPIGIIFGEEASSALTEQIGGAIKEGISALLARLVDLLSVIASSVPRVLFFILISVIAAVYFALDLDRINAFIKSLLPEKTVNLLIGFKNSCISVGMKYLRSYLLLMLITFAVMVVGFLILRVENLVLLATVIALLDLLPLIGVGTVIVPWSVFELVLGNTGRGIGLIVLLVVHELIRQFAEPKIIGKNLGVHPLISLLLLYVGYSAFGFVGLLLVPVLAVVLNVLVSKSKSENQSIDAD